MSQVQFVGNLTADPEIHRSPNNPEAVRVTFSVAVNRRYTDTRTGQVVEKPTYFDCIAWREFGLNLAASLAKGDRVVVLGSHEQSFYTVTGPDGEQRRSRWEVQVQAIGPDLRYARASVTKQERAATPAATPLEQQPAMAAAPASPGTWGEEGY